MRQANPVPPTAETPDSLQEERAELERVFVDPVVGEPDNQRADVSTGTTDSAEARPPRRNWRRDSVWLGLAVVWSFTLGWALGPGPVGMSATPSTPGAGPAVPFRDSAIRILVGFSKPTVDALGRRWEPDDFFTGGTVRSTPGGPAGKGPVYQAAREGQFQYDIPLTPGVYELRLHFIETDFGNVAQGGETSRLFDVDVNGVRVLDDFDIIADAGGTRQPDVRVFTDVSPADDGKLHLSFSHPEFTPILSGIEILPGLPGKMLPLRFTAQSEPYVSAEGILWSPDHYMRGGQTAEHEATVEGTLDPGLFRVERFGNFKYTIPVAPGRYRLTLHFAETYFGEANGRTEGVGARVFDVFCNGRTLLSEIDVFEEAGGENRALLKTFSGLEPNAQQKLILDFVPVQNLATLSALELVAE